MIGHGKVPEAVTRTGVIPPPRGRLPGTLLIAAAMLMRRLKTEPATAPNTETDP